MEGLQYITATPTTLSSELKKLKSALGTPKMTNIGNL